MIEPIKDENEKERANIYGLTYKEIGELLNISGERVRQIKERALKKMRKEIIKHKDELGEFLMDEDYNEE